MKRLGMNARLPFLINFFMTLSTFFSFQTLQPDRNLLVGNGMRIILAQAKNNNGTHFGVKNIDSDPHQHNEKEPDSHMPGSFGFHIISCPVKPEDADRPIQPALADDIRPLNRPEFGH